MYWIPSFSSIARCSCSCWTTTIECTPFLLFCLTVISVLSHLSLGVRSTFIRSMFRIVLDCVWNVVAHAQKPDFVFRGNGRVHLNRRGRQFSRLLAAEVCASAVLMVVMLDTPCSEVVWRILATHSIRKFRLHFSSRASPNAITFQLDSTVFLRSRSSSVENGLEFPLAGEVKRRRP